MTDSITHSTLRDVEEEIMGRMLKILLQEIRNRPGQQIPSDSAMKICVSRMDKPLAKAVGGKDALRRLAGKVIDNRIETGFFVQVETAKKVMLRHNTNRN